MVTAINVNELGTFEFYNTCSEQQLYLSLYVRRYSHVLYIFVEFIG